MSAKPIVIRVGPVTSRIENGVLDHVTINTLSESCSYEVDGAEHMKRSGRFGGRYSKKEWDGKKRLYHKGHRTFGTGLLERVNVILASHGYEPQLVHTPNPITKISLPKPGPEWDLRDYQRKSVLTCLESGRGMVKVATGGGKTVIAGHLIKAVSTKAIFLVHTKDLLYQAKSTFESMFGAENVGQVGDGVVDSFKNIVVCTIQTAARALDVEYTKDSYAEGDEDGWRDKETPTLGIQHMFHNAGLVIMDECHRVAAQTASDVVTSINAPYRFGFSASPWRDDGADLVLEAVFGEVIVDINASTLIDMGHLVSPIIRVKQVQPGRFPKGTNYSTIYEQYIVENEQRNAMVCLAADKTLKRDIPTMILVRHIKHGTLIKGLLEAYDYGGYSVPFLTGKDDSQTRNSVIGDMRAGRLKSLIATTIADEGLDIKPLAGLVLAGGGKSSTRALQRVGRVLRPFEGKKVAEVTDFEDNARFLYDHSRARVKMYESESRFTIVDF